MIGQFFAPEVIKPLSKVSSTQISLPVGMNVLVGGLGVTTDTTLTGSISTTGLGGLDTGTVAASTLYYVYLVISGTSFGLVLSTSSSGPLGYAAFREVGKFITNAASQIDATPWAYGHTIGWQEYDISSYITSWTNGGSTTSAKGIPYRTKDGTWHMWMSVYASRSNNTVSTATFSGNILFVSSQALASFSSNGQANAYTSGSNTIAAYSSAASTWQMFTGDVELTAKPSFVTQDSPNY